VILLAALTTFACAPIAVYDGDGPIWCEEGPKIRIADIGARELDGECMLGHPCPAASGIEARDALVDLLGGAKGTLRTGHLRVSHPAMQCARRGTSYERVVASCRLPDGRDLGDALLATGTVLRW
jgi:endonuclease YncB( thermonuclease family)